MNGATEATLAELLRVAQSTNANIAQLTKLSASASTTQASSGGGMSISGPIGVAFGVVGGAAKLVGGAFGVLTGIIGSTIGVLTTTGANLISFAQAAMNGTARLSDFYAAFKDLPLGLGALAGAMSSMVKYTEELFDQFKVMSKAGAGFGGDLFEMRASAARAGLTLKELTAVVDKNSETFAAGGRGVQAGLDAFVKGMNTLWYGNLRPDLTGLGVSAAEAADYMVTMMKSQRYYSTSASQNSETLAQKTRNYVIELDSMSRMTGVHRDVLNASIADASKDQVWQSFLASLGSDKEREAKGQALAIQRAQFGDEWMKKAGMDILMGLPMNDYLAKAAFATEGASVEFAANALKISNDMSISSTERNRLMTIETLKLGNAAASFSSKFDGTTQALLRSQLVPELSKLGLQFKASNLSYSEYIATTERKQVEQLRKDTVAKAMAETEENIKGFGNTLSTLYLRVLGPLLPELIGWGNQFIAWSSNFIKNNLGSITQFIDQAITVFKEQILPNIEAVGKWFSDTFKRLIDDDTSKTFWEKLKERVADGFKKMWDFIRPIWVNDVKPVLLDVFRSLGSVLEPLFVHLFKSLWAAVQDALNAMLYNKLGAMGGAFESPEKRQQSRNATAAQENYEELKAALASARQDKDVSKDRLAEMQAGLAEAGAAWSRAYHAWEGTPVPTQYQIKGKASGGSVNPGSYLVGENGPEVLNVGSSGDVINNDNLKQLLARVANEKPASSVLEELNNTMQQLLRYASATAENTGRTNGAIAGLSGNIMPVI